VNLLIIKIFTITSGALILYFGITAQTSPAFAQSGELILECSGTETVAYYPSLESESSKKSENFHFMDGRFGNMTWQIAKFNQMYISVDQNFKPSHLSDMSVISYFLLIDRYTGEVSKIVWSSINSNAFAPAAMLGDRIKSSFKGKCKTVTKKF
jgi:hypothetical protein